MNRSYRCRDLKTRLDDLHAPKPDLLIARFGYVCDRFLLLKFI